MLTNVLDIVDPKKQIRLTLAYPASTGRNFPEILRVIDSLQLGDKHRITTPANWGIPDPKTGQVEERVIVHPSVQGEEVKQLFGDDVQTVYVSLWSFNFGALLILFGSLTYDLHPTLPRRRSRPRLLRGFCYCTKDVRGRKKTGTVKRGIPVVKMNLVHKFAV